MKSEIEEAREFETVTLKKSYRATSRSSRLRNLSFLISFLVILVSLVAYFFLKTHLLEGSYSREVIEKPLLDNREYKYIELPNKLRLILVSDPSTQISAASINVKIGHYSNPEDMQGLAHYIEHMLFINSFTYPEVNGYWKLIEQNSGMANAFTRDEDTNYMFQIPNYKFQEALDMFSHFFIDPQFDSHYLEREVHAVNSEYEMILQNDNFRLPFILRKISDPKNSFSYNPCGNIHTLKEIPEKNGVNISQRVFDHYNSKYSSNIMSGALFSNLSIPELEETAHKYFSAIKNKNLEIEKEKVDNLWGKLPRIVSYIPIKKINHLNLIFGCPATDNFAEVMPMEFIFTYLDHSGESSLKDLLIEKGWITQITQDSVIESSSVKNFYLITFELTEEGINHVYEILQYFYSYLDLIMKEGITPDRYKEAARIKRISFDYSVSDEDPFDFVTMLGISLKYGHPNKVLTKGNLFLKFDKEEIQNFISKTLNLSNIVIVVASSNLKFSDYEDPIQLDGNKIKFVSVNHKDDIYKIQYANFLPPPDFIAKVNQAPPDSKFKLPSSNKFIPQDFTLFKPTVDIIGQSLAPNRLIKEEHYEIWHSQFNIKKHPDAVLYLELHDEHACESLTNKFLFIVIYKRFSKLVDKLNSEASLAGYQIEFKIEGNELKLKISGIGDKLLDVLEEILNGLRKDHPSEEDFNHSKKQASDFIENYKANKLFLFAFWELNSALRSCAQKWDQIKPIEDQLSYNNFIKAYESFSSRVYAKVLVAGNIPAEKVSSRVNSVLNPWNFQGGNYRPEPVYFNSKSIVHKAISNLPESKEQVTVNYYMHNPRSLPLYTSLSMIDSLMSSYVFDELRTKQALGYVCIAGQDTRLHLNSFYFMVQGPNHSPYDFDLAIEKVLMDYEKILKEVTEEELENVKEGIKQKVIENRKSLDTTIENWMKEISWNTHRFNFDYEVMERIDSITKMDVITTFETVFKYGGKVSMQIFKGKTNGYLPENQLNETQQYSGLPQKWLPDILMIQQMT